MTVLTRFGRLLRADLHALLDRMEAPDVLLQQSLREMQADLESRHNALKKRQHDRFLLEQRIVQLSAQLAQHTTEMDLCFQAQNDTLMRTLVRRQLEQAQRLRTLTVESDALSRLIDDENTRIQEHTTQLLAMQQQAQHVLQGQPSSPHTPEHCDAGAITDADVELALLKEIQRRKNT